MEIKFEVVGLSIKDVEADAVAIKYPQTLEAGTKGTRQDLGKRDQILRRQLGLPRGVMTLPAEGNHLLEKTPDKKTKSSLIVGVPKIGRFTYKDAKTFAHQALKALKANPETSHVSFTAPEEQLGVDPVEAFYAEVCGILRAVEMQDAPERLKKITFATDNPKLFIELRTAKEKLFPQNGILHIDSPTMLENLDFAAKQIYREYSERNTADKPFVFVAMPFDESMYDNFYYPIRLAAESEKLLCERVDTVSFSTDIVERIMERIDASVLVIADVSKANPNVLFELGYAVGKGKPTINIAEKDTKLPFDIQNVNTIFYKGLVDLQKQLARRFDAERRRKDQAGGRTKRRRR